MFRQLPGGGVFGINWIDPSLEVTYQSSFANPIVTEMVYEPRESGPFERNVYVNHHVYVNNPVDTEADIVSDLTDSVSPKAEKYLYTSNMSLFPVDYARERMIGLDMPYEVQSYRIGDGSVQFVFLCVKKEFQQQYQLRRRVWSNKLELVRVHPTLTPIKEKIKIRLDVDTFPEEAKKYLSYCVMGGVFVEKSQPLWDSTTYLRSYTPGKIHIMCVDAVYKDTLVIRMLSQSDGNFQGVYLVDKDVVR